jgi:aryl-alcohol dehydrogenase-like predicted oxidoreductase
MFKRQLGRSGLEASGIGLGCWAIGGPWTFDGYPAGWGQVDDEESIRALHCALDRGIDFFDTAANYGCGHSERLLGRAVAGRRDRVIIATKFGYDVDEEAKNVTHYGDPRSGDVVSRIRQDCEASLRRLNTDYIDLYHFHVGYYSPEKAVQVHEVLEELVSEGKIRFYGWSTDAPESARVFAEGEHCATIQHDLTVVKDAPEMLAVCEELDLGSIVRSPLGRGLLTGKYDFDSTFPENDIRHRGDFRDRWLLPILGQVDAVRGVLTGHGRTLAQGALAWVWARSDRTVPIPGFKTVKQVEENVAALEVGPLNEEQMKQIDELLGRSR